MVRGVAGSALNWQSRADGVALRRRFTRRRWSRESPEKLAMVVDRSNESRSFFLRVLVVAGAHPDRGGVRAAQMHEGGAQLRGSSEPAQNLRPQQARGEKGGSFRLLLSIRSAS